jgi:hypothetical protein
MKFTTGIKKKIFDVITILTDFSKLFSVLRGADLQREKGNKKKSQMSERTKSSAVDQRNISTP